MLFVMSGGFPKTRPLLPIEISLLWRQIVLSMASHPWCPLLLFLYFADTLLSRVCLLISLWIVRDHIDHITSSRWDLCLSSGQCIYDVHISFSLLSFFSFYVYLFYFIFFWPRGWALLFCRPWFFDGPRYALTLVCRLLGMFWFI